MGRWLDPFLGWPIDMGLGVELLSFQPILIQIIGQAHNAGLCFIDGELLTRASTATQNIGVDSLIAEGRTRAVEETLQGVLFHGARGVLGGFLTLILVKGTHDAAHHFTR